MDPHAVGISKELLFEIDANEYVREPIAALGIEDLAAGRSAPARGGSG
jgi:hypothetical protein